MSSPWGLLLPEEPPSGQVVQGEEVTFEDLLLSPACTVLRSCLEGIGIDLGLRFDCPPTKGQWSVLSRLEMGQSLCVQGGPKSGKSKLVSWFKKICEERGETCLVIDPDSLDRFVPDKPPTACARYLTGASVAKLQRHRNYLSRCEFIEGSPLYQLKRAQAIAIEDGQLWTGSRLFLLHFVLNLLNTSHYRGEPFGGRQVLVVGDWAGHHLDRGLVDVTNLREAPKLLYDLERCTHGPIPRDPWARELLEVVSLEESFSDRTLLNLSLRGDQTLSKYLQVSNLSDAIAMSRGLIQHGDRLLRIVDRDEDLRPLVTEHRATVGVPAIVTQGPLRGHRGLVRMIATEGAMILCADRPCFAMLQLDEGGFVKIEDAHQTLQQGVAITVDQAIRFKPRSALALGSRVYELLTILQPSRIFFQTPPNIRKSEAILTVRQA